MPNNETTSWSDAIRAYTHPRVLGMFFLGFSAGLPLLLVFSTLSAWLRDIGIERTTIGFVSWVGITFSIKVLWAPIIDQMPIPFLTKLMGKRRSWLILAQLGIVLGLLLMSLVNPLNNIVLLAQLAVIVAFCSATQDICIDAYRIEATEEKFQAAMAANYIFGYRTAMLFAGAGALYLADYFSWATSYALMASLMIVGIITTFVIDEPEHLQASTQIAFSKSSTVAEKISHWTRHAIIEPFAEFFQRNAYQAIIILLFISVFRISDITMGVMANPFYIDMGFSKSEIASIAKFFGLGMTLVGSMLGGILVYRIGILKTLLMGAVLVAFTNLGFAWMALQSNSIPILAAVISADNLAGGLSNVAFIAYLSSLVNKNYTATQYALFSSLMTLPGKFVGGFSGWIVDTSSYNSFFIYAAATGIPAIILVLYLIKQSQSNEAQIS